MKHCPNPECRYRKRHGAPAEYQDQATTCSDCGTALIEAPAAAAPVPAGPEAASVKKPRRAEDSGPWGKLAVTFLCCAVYLLASFTPLPGTWELQRAIQSSGGLLALFNIRISALQLSLMALGFTPILWAYGLVELAAVVVPAWRPLRIGGFEGRAALRRWIVPLAALFAFVQSVGIGNYLRGLSAHEASRGYIVSGAFILRPWVPWTAVLVLPLGTLLVALLAEAINRWGLGNGFSCLLLTAATSAIGPALLQTVLQSQASEETGAGHQALLLALVIGALLLGTMALLGRGPFRLEPKPFSLALPPSGLDPVSAATMVAWVPITAAGYLGLQLDLSIFSSLEASVVSLVLVGSLGVALSILYSQPRRVARVWQGKAPSEAEVGAVWVQVATAAVLGTVLLLALRSTVVLMPYLNLPLYLDLSLFLAPVAVVLDLAREWSFRRSHPRLVPAWPVHRVYAVQPALKALEDAGIPAFPRGLHHRTLLQLFGPYVPVSLLVPEDRAEEAARIVSERLADSKA